MSRATRKLRRERQSGPQLVAYRGDRLSAQEAAIAAARASGCTCSPTVAVRGVQAIVSHDGWCALLRREDVN
jgi:hypothetical protein